MNKLNEIYNSMLDAGIMLSSGSYHLKGECDAVIIRYRDKYGVFLDIDRIRTTAQEKEAVSHEWAHFKTGALYSMDAAPAVIARAEHKALKYQIQDVIPKDELDAAVAEGRTEIWELAEYFNVTERFMRLAVCWYERGTLDLSQI